MKQTAVEWFAKQVLRSRQLGFISNEKFNELLEQAKAMEKEQKIDLIKHTAMFMGASNFDKEIASMTFEDVYNSYYNETFK